MKKDEILLKNALLDIEKIPITTKCKDCNFEKNISMDNIYFTCKNCNSNNVEILKGKELYIEFIEID